MDTERKPMKETSKTSSNVTLDPNSYLEEQVQRLVRKHLNLKSNGGKDISKQEKVEESNKNCDDPVIQVASLPKIYDGIVRAGTPIYVSRLHFPVLAFSTLALGLIGWGLYDTNIAIFSSCLIAAIVGYDFLSGFLHVVFDDTRNLHIPILGQPCLEFQMHHYFPTDLVQRDFLDVCGDLNFVVTFLTIWNLCILDIRNSPISRFMAGFKMLMAYYGQFSHRAAHTPSSSKNVLVEALRSLNIMIPLEKHRSHHRPPHDKDYCLIGVCNPVVNFLYSQVTTNRWFWMFGFLTIGLGGMSAEVVLMNKILPVMGLKY